MIRLPVDLILRNGTVVTASDTLEADVAIRDGVVVQLGRDLPGPAAREIDVSGKYLVPGGVDVHTHCEAELAGVESVDDFHSSTVQAACGGVTTVVDYALTGEDQSLLDSVEQWNRMARGKTVIDYGLHVALHKPDDRMIGDSALLLGWAAPVLQRRARCSPKNK